MTAAVTAEWVGLTSPTQPRAGHGSHPCQGLYHYPARGAAATTAFIATHYSVDFSEHYLAEYLATRGFGFLGWNTRYRGNDAYFMLENAVTDIGVGMTWLREHPSVERIVILGNSGGGSLMGAYQAQAAGLGLPAADLYVSVNSHPGRPEVLTAWLDASVSDELDPLEVDPDLDPFDAAHGPPYGPEFVDRYRKAQHARNDRITEWAQAELVRLGAAGSYDRTFSVNRAWADLRFTDLTLDPSDRNFGCYAGDPKWANFSPFGLAAASTCRSWLSMWSLQTSQCQGAPHLQQITVPSLVVQSMADRGVFPSDAHAIFDALAADDKQLEFLPGEHYFEDGGRDDVADLIAAWVTYAGMRSKPR